MLAVLIGDYRHIESQRQLAHILPAALCRISRRQLVQPAYAPDN